MNDKFINLIVNLHDGDSAGAADGGDENGESGVATSTDNNNISRETREKAERIGIGDDLIDDYNKAFGNGNQNQNNTEGENNSTDTDGEENLEEEFEKLIKGKFKNVYQNRAQSLVKDRLSTKTSRFPICRKKKAPAIRFSLLLQTNTMYSPMTLTVFSKPCQRIRICSQKRLLPQE